MSDESVCSVCSRLTGFGDEDKAEAALREVLESWDPHERACLSEDEARCRVAQIIEKHGVTL